MGGGLIQLTSEGIQNEYLTILPEITYFKNVYRRYTNFGLETTVLTFDQELKFGRTVSLTINNYGDLISRNWVKVSFPEFIPDISRIENIDIENNYNNIKKIRRNEIEIQKVKYNNLLKYGELIFGGFQIIERYRESINRNINLLETLISKYFNSIKESYNDIINFIDINIVERTNIISYILEISDSITIDKIIETSDKYQNNLLKEMSINLLRLKRMNDEYEELLNRPIRYKWKRHLGHYLFKKIQIEIDGEIIDEINSEQLEVYYQHNLSEDMKINYERLINGKSNEGFNIFIPLNFWYNKKFNMGLPLVALRHCAVKLNFVVNRIENLVDLLDFEDEYNSLRSMRYNREEMDVELNGKSFIFNNRSYDLSSIRYNNDLNEVVIVNEVIREDNLRYHFSYLSINDINSILESYGSIREGELSLDKIELERFILEIPENENLSKKILEWRYHVDRFSQLDNYELETSELYGDYIFMDELEREKFANSNLEYIVLLNQLTSYDIDQDYLNVNLEFENHIKDIFWVIQKKSDLLGNRLNGPDYLRFLDEKNIDSFQLVLDGYKVFPERNSPSYFNLLQNYKNLNSSFDSLIYYYSFSLHPEEDQPTGGCSFNEIKGKQFIINLKEGVIENNGELVFKIFGRKQLVFVINKGKGKLAFFNKT